MWQPIATAPKDGTEILIAREGRKDYLIAAWREYGNEFLWCERGLRFHALAEPTHWQPLPEPP